ncbi:Tn3 family transposase, partial [Chloroflexales bacterium ZM16-3]|nr:Tn3 family transposase [Chloroflexales bacterium ZM16-3]
LLAWFQHEGCFPTHAHEIPLPVLHFLAKQVSVTPDVILTYDWEGRTAERYRAQIRQTLGVRETTVADAEALMEWLATTQAPQQPSFDALKIALLTHCRSLRMEPPSPLRIERLIRSAMHLADTRCCQRVVGRLTVEARAGLDALLVVAQPDTVDAVDVSPIHAYSPLHTLKTDAGRISLDSMQTEIAKLQQIRALNLPTDLFATIAPKAVAAYRQRLEREDLHEVRRHPDPIRYTLLAAYGHLRGQEITDTLVDLLIAVVAGIGTRAEQTIDRQVLKEITRVRGKNRLFYAVAEAALAHPDEVVRTVVYPAAGGEQTLRDLVAEYQATDSYERQIQRTMRRTYGHHYRRMLPNLLRVLTFRSNNTVHRPVIRAIDLLIRYADRTQLHYDVGDDVPMTGVVPTAWRDLVEQTSARGGVRINRITYELCVLQAVREQLRCRELWVEGANRFRNPDDDLPHDFDTGRSGYYAALRLPTDVETFIAQEQAALRKALTTLNDGLPGNSTVSIRTRHARSRFVVSPLAPQPEPQNLTRVKAEVGHRWPTTSLLDILKEAALRIGFTNRFSSVTAHEALDPATLQQRLLLCLYGLGTNTGLKAVSASDHGAAYRDLLYVRRRFITRDHLRAAIQDVVNATLRVRRPEIWGTATTACASDSKKFGAWDQNILTEWHIRYRGPGIMVYWHVERKSVCIYSQLKRCSSSEVAAMIEGVLRHCTEMAVQQNYVDTHGQSEVAFAFCSLLGFQLLPRIKGVGRQKLSPSDVGAPEAYPNLQGVLTRPINWELIRQQYDEMVKYATALRLGTAEAEAILRRFTRSGPQHPTYQALAEYGKVRKTIFLCDYLQSEALRREIHEGLNVIESWNGANSFVFYGRGGEIATNQHEDQELALLALHLVQNCLVYINTLMVQQVLAEPTWMARMRADDLRALTPLFYRHVNPYGLFQLDMTTRLDLEDRAA